MFRSALKSINGVLGFEAVVSFSCHAHRSLEEPICLIHDGRLFLCFTNTHTLSPF